jgi:lysophospholipase L1-like esterase
MPYVGWRSKPLTSPTVNIEADGTRTHSVGLDNAANAKTIGFFGGSAMWGTGSDDDNTIPAVFDRQTSDYIVQNYAELAWVSRQNLAQLINLTNQQQAPDVVVFYDGYNDVRILCNRAFTKSLNGTAREGRLRSIIELRKTGGHVYRNLVLPFIELVTPQHSGDPSEQYSCDRDPKMAERVAEVMVQNWSIAAQIAESRGGTFVGFLQPSVFTGSPRVDHLPDNVNSNWRDRDVLQREYDAVYPIIREKLGRAGVRWKDLSNVFDGDQYYYVDTSHVGPSGNHLLVKHMMEFVESTIEEEPILRSDQQ